MEDFLMGLLPNAGITTIGFVFLYFVMKEYFKQMGSVIDEITKLCAEIKGLVTSFNGLRELQATQQELDRALAEDIKESYLKISAKIEAQNIKIDEINIMCHNLVDDKAKIPIGVLAISKGYMNKEQLNELLEEQVKFKRS